MDYKDYEAEHKAYNFWFRAKNDLIYRLLSKISLSKTLRKSRKVSDLKILSLGAGTGDDLEILNKFGKVYLIDINKKALDLIPKRLYFEKKVSDACKLKYKDNFFDVITSFDVFEHIDDDNLAINEAYRVLKKGGYLIFSVPAFQSLYSSHDKALGHKRRYSKNDLINPMKKFRETEISYWNFFLFLPMALFRLINKNSQTKVDSDRPLPLLDKIDNLLFRLLKIENLLIERNFSFPFGLTIFGIAKK